jgi:hypothetical protein
MTNKFNLGKKGEGGQILIFTAIVVAVAALVLPSILALTYSSAHTTDIRLERMQVLYGADSGIEDALYTLDNLGNGTSLKVPAEIQSPPITYYLPGYTNDSRVKVTIDKDGNGTYLITSTGNNTQNRKVTIQVHVSLGDKQVPVGPVYQPGEGNVSTTPFDYAVASLGPTGPDFKTHPPTISGDVYSNGPIDFGTGAKVQSDGVHAGNVWAIGTITLENGVTVSGSVHSGGDIIMSGSAASIGKSAYANGSIQATGTANKIWDSAGAYGAISLQNASGIAHSSVAYGDVTVSGPVNPDTGTVTHTNGIINGTITQGAPPFALTLPPVPTLVASNVTYWQDLYKTQAKTGWIIPPNEFHGGTYTPASGNVYLGNTYIAGNLEVKNGTVLHLGNNTSVYVEGTATIKSGANIMGTGKLVAVGNMGLFNNLIGDLHAMPLLMTLGCFNMYNNGNLYAVLYAPNCSVDLQNWNTVTGAVVAQSITGGQGTTINWDPDVWNIPGLPGGNVTEGNGTWIPVEQPPLVEYTGVQIDFYRVCDNENCD